MAIYRGTQQAGRIYRGATLIGKIYRGAVLVYTSIRSCFGKGLWINSQPWLNTDGWKNSI